MSYTMGSLFAGIGGFDLGFERAGFKTSWQVEIDPYCQKVLAKNFREAERFGDIRECCGVRHKFSGSDGKPLCDMRNHLKPVDVICGGFPCQDISNAGLRAGIEGERSGLWKEYARIVCELRPKFVVVENVAALLGRGMGVVLGDLAEIGYDADWDCISASDMGAPHLRERIWVLAHRKEDAPCADAYCFRPYRSGVHLDRGSEFRDKQISLVEPVGSEMANADHAGLERRHREELRECAGERATREGCACAVPDATGWCEQSGSTQRDERRLQNQTLRGVGYSHNWEVEPNVGRVAHGIPKRVDRLRGLGNAVVPQIPEMIARRIKQALEVA